VLLQDALSRLNVEVEERRAAMRELLSAVGLVANTLALELRDTDTAVVGGQTFRVVHVPIGGATMKTLVMNNGLLGPRATAPRGDWPYASLGDNEWFARHVTDVVDAFADSVVGQRLSLEATRALLEKSNETHVGQDAHEGQQGSDATAARLGLSRRP
jgi:hypothetical protein